MQFGFVSTKKGGFEMNAQQTKAARVSLELTVRGLAATLASTAMPAC